MNTLTINVCGVAGVGKSIVAAYLKRKLLKKGFSVEVFDNNLNSDTDPKIKSSDIKKGFKQMSKGVNIKIQTVLTRIILPPIEKPKAKKSAVLGLALLFLMSGVVMAETNQINETKDTPVYGSIEVPVFSSYYNRGRLLKDEAVIQPYISLLKDTSAGTFSFSTFGNIVAEDYFGNDDSGINETDLILGYSKTDGVLTYGGGLIEYIYSGLDIENTHEIFVTSTLAIPKAFPVNPSLAIYYDFKEVDGFYAEAGLSHTFTFSEMFSMVAYTGLGYADSNYNEYMFGVKDDQFNGLSSGLTFNAKKGKFTFSAGGFYGTTITDDIGEGAKGIYGDKDATVGKVSMLYSF